MAGAPAKMAPLTPVINVVRESMLLLLGVPPNAGLLLVVAALRPVFPENAVAVARSRARSVKGGINIIIVVVVFIFFPFVAVVVGVYYLFVCFVFREVQEGYCVQSRMAKIDDFFPVPGDDVEYERLESNHGPMTLFDN